MSIYLVALNEPNEGAWKRLQNRWPKPHRYVLTDRLALVAPEEIMLTEDVRDVVGMNDEHEVTGFVAEIQHNTIDGWNRQALWEWLRKNQ